MTQPYDPAVNRREAMLKRYLSSPFFLLALLCFLLPFFAVTCAGGGFSGVPGLGGAGDPADVSGVQLITGQADDEIAKELGDFAEDAGGGLGGGLPIPGPSPSIPGIPDALQSSEKPDLGGAQMWAIAAAVIALLGVFLALLAGRLGALLALILGVAGGGTLLVLSSTFKSSIDKFGEQVLTGEPRLGFWLALGGFGLAAIMGLIRLLIPDRPEATPAEGDAGFGQPPPPPAPPPESPPQ
jgi:hypothetical protein